MQAALHGADRATEPTGNLFLGEPFEVAEDDG
jgi:hypothetical protein